jgi:hypothetical protein
MWKKAFKESFKFLFDNPVIFLALLGNYVLLFMFGPFIGVFAGFLIATLYLIGLHGNINDIVPEFKRFARWGFLVALILYLLFFGEGIVSYLVYNYLLYGLKISYGGLLIFTVFWSLLLLLILHAVYIPLFASKNWKEFVENLKRVKVLFTTSEGIGTLILLWGFMFLTLLAGLVKFLRFTVGLYSVIATFWLTYYTFLGVRVFKNKLLREEIK